MTTRHYTIVDEQDNIIIDRLMDALEAFNTWTIYGGKMSINSKIVNIYIKEV